MMSNTACEGKKCIEDQMFGGLVEVKYEENESKDNIPGEIQKFLSISEYRH